MTPSIEEIQEQITNLQRTLETLKNPKMEVSRHFTGQYFTPYQGRQYRRMESGGIPIWECFLDIKKEWVMVNKPESEQLEKCYLSDCTSPPEEPKQTKK